MTKYNLVSRIFVRVCIYTTTLIIAYAASRSIWVPTPLDVADVVIFVDHTNQGYVLSEVRKYVGKMEETMFVNRILYQESDPQNYFTTESGSFRALVGEFPVINTYVLPEWMKGRWCSQVTLRWNPSWAQRGYHLDTKVVCFETTEYE